MSEYWACAQTHPNGEALALRNLKRQAFEAFYPFVEVNHPRFKRLVTRPVFPGYIFVRLDDEVHNWAPINNTFGVKRLLTQATDGDYRRPARIGFVDDLRKLRLRPEPQGEVLPPGTIVRVVKGPFAEKTALVEMSSSDRVRLLLQAFNRDISIEFSLDAVQVIRRPVASSPLVRAYSYG